MLRRPNSLPILSVLFERVLIRDDNVFQGYESLYTRLRDREWGAREADTTRSRRKRCGAGFTRRWRMSRRPFAPRWRDRRKRLTGVGGADCQTLATVITWITSGTRLETEGALRCLPPATIISLIRWDEVNPIIEIFYNPLKKILPSSFLLYDTIV